MKNQTPILAMRSLFLAVILSVAFGRAALARFIHVWSKDQMQKASQLIVIGTIVKVKDLDETNAVLWPGYKFRGVETTFAVTKILQGVTTNSSVVLHHYRFDPPGEIPGNGPFFLELTPANTNRFLLYLIKDGDTRFAPISGQVDPALDAVTVYTNK